MSAPGKSLTLSSGKIANPVVFKQEDTLDWKKWLSSSLYRQCWKQHKEFLAGLTPEEEMRKKDIPSYHEALVERIKKHSNTSGAITVWSPDGLVDTGMVAALITNAMAEVSRRQVLAIDHTPLGGSLAFLLGRASSHKCSTRDALQMAGKSSSEFLMPLAITDNGAYVLGSPTKADRDRPYSGSMASTNIETGLTHCQFVINLLGPDAEASYFDAVMRQTGVLVMPTTTDSHIMWKTRAAVENLKLLGHDQLVGRLLTVVTGLNPGDSLEEYREPLGLDTAACLLTTLNGHEPSRQPISLPDLDTTMMISALEIVLTSLYVLNKADNENFATEIGLTGFHSGQLANLKNGRTPVLPWSAPSDLDI